MTIMLCRRLMVLRTVFPVTLIGRVLLLWKIGMLTLLLSAVSRLVVVGWQMLYVVSSGEWFRPPSRQVSPMVVAAPLEFRRFMSTTIPGT